MHKIILTLIFGYLISFAEIINGIALTVNDDPITLYDIELTMKQKNVDKNKAVSLIIDKLLYKQLIKKHNITADIFEVNEYIEKLAARNNMDVYTFKSILQQKYQDYSIFENEAKKSVLRDKLLMKIVKGNLLVANEEDMKSYYNKNQNKFSIANSFKVIKYSSKNRKSLVLLQKNPLSNFDDVETVDTTFEAKSISPQLQFLLNNTATNDFTPIFTDNRVYNMIYVLKKEGSKILDYENVKQQIFSDIMKNREQKYLEDFFEKQKLTANIKIIR